MSRNVKLFLVILSLHSIYWATAWCSPWPFLILNGAAIIYSKGILKPWGTIISQALNPDYDLTILKIAIPFILLNYVATFACIFMFGTILDSSGNVVEGVWTNFYFSAVTLTTLGYGNLVPGDVFTEVVASIEALIGFMGFAVLAGVVGSIAIKRIGS